jgi:hypothetical protein
VRGYLEWDRRSAPTGVEEGGTEGEHEGEGGAAVVAVTGLAGRRWAVTQPTTYCWYGISLLPSFQRKAPL